MTKTIKMIVPSSKSQTQRALILSALSRGESRIESPSPCDDSSLLRNALVELGINISTLDDGSWLVKGGNWQIPVHHAESNPRQMTATPLWCGDAGTTLRFLAPLALILKDEIILDGSSRLRERPIGELIAALQELRVNIRYLAQDGCLPVALKMSRQPNDTAREKNVGVSVPEEKLDNSDQREFIPCCHLDASRSSQFVSGLLMIGPLLPRGIILSLTKPAVSRPYLNMTIEAMRSFGAQVLEEPNKFIVPHQEYTPTNFIVEGDWSGASFLLAAAWITKRIIEIPNVSHQSQQGDKAIVQFLQNLDQPGPCTFDLRDCPDLVAPLASVAAFSSYPVYLVNAGHVRLKESDRLVVLAKGLRQAGIWAREDNDGLVIQPGGTLVPTELDPCGDHRMAMAFALLSLKEPGIKVLHPECVSKSYPDFWEDLQCFRE